MQYRIIIAGGRDFTDYELLRKESLRAVRETFGKVNKEDVWIISGRARGADSLGERFAKEFDLNLKYFPADWDKYGKGAGFRRNEQMADFAKGKDENDPTSVKNLVIAFWDGQSRGTHHMIEIAKNKKMNIRVVRY